MFGLWDLLLPLRSFLVSPGLRRRRRQWRRQTTVKLLRLCLLPLLRLHPSSPLPCLPPWTFGLWDLLLPLRSFLELKFIRLRLLPLLWLRLLPLLRLHPPSPSPCPPPWTFGLWDLLLPLRRFLVKFIRLSLLPLLRPSLVLLLRLQPPSLKLLNQNPKLLVCPLNLRMNLMMTSLERICLLIMMMTGKTWRFHLQRSLSKVRRGPMTLPWKQQSLPRRPNRIHLQRLKGKIVDTQIHLTRKRMLVVMLRTRNWVRSDLDPMVLARLTPRPSALPSKEI
ncbi:unnamed protein product [Linum tenue]|uniref:Uncharacterized protein n=1 Tax=Linum tenue TaxID=586396 RepID=A0AAV0ILC6_9ROSI|nr:unnamed protein product [Linum tenue]